MIRTYSPLLASLGIFALAIGTETAEPLAAQSPLAQSPLAQSPLAQSPLAQSPLAQSPLAQSPSAQSPSASEAIRFESHIRPIFREYCFDCHGAAPKLQANLDLRLVRFIEKGGESGPALSREAPEASRLLELISSGEMPPGDARVSSEKVDLVRKWLVDGAPTMRPEPESIGPGIPISPEERSYWAYQPIAATTPPNFAQGKIQSPIDAWLSAAMPSGLGFSPEAPRHTLIKRAYMDLIGLPPTDNELQKWLDAAEVDWFENMLDQLLDSPHYGERWARHWLDVAGYSDSDGYTLADADRPWAWKYRDYVIRSLNGDKPFDRFIMEQLAGDELAGTKQGDWTAQQIELLTATGFLRTAADGTGSGDDSPEARNKVIADTLKIVGSALLGSSLNCAQCHDHRYDPISQLDYVAIRSVFEPALDWQQWQTPPSRLVSLYTDQNRKQANETEEAAKCLSAARDAKREVYMEEALEKELSKYEEPLREKLKVAYKTNDKERSPEQKELLAKHPSVNISPGVLYQYLPKAAEELTKLDKEIAALRAEKPVEEFVRVLTEPSGHAPVAKLFYRGEFQQPQQEVIPAALSVAVPEGERIEFAKDDSQLPTTGRRLAFARWLVSPTNPLTARVIVNRIWMHHFGVGLVASPGEFGKLGMTPSHPQLLDWLATQFVERGWSMKQLHRIILRSTAWRQSSHRDPAKEAIDPENRFYWRKNIQRLDAEIIRDRMLAVAGQLQDQPYGPPIAIKEDETGQVIVDGTQTRRSLYIRSRRTQPVAMLQTFDAPVMEINCEYRPVSTVATQSLVLLNGEFTLDQAKNMAQRITLENSKAVPTSQPASSPPTSSQPADANKAASGSCQMLDKEQFAAQVSRAWQLAYGRTPNPQEFDTVIRFATNQLTQLQSEPRGVAAGSSPERQLLVNLCHMLLNSNEFLYVD